MARPDTQDWYRSDIGENYKIGYRKKTTLAHMIRYLSPNVQPNFLTWRDML